MRKIKPDSLCKIPSGFKGLLLLMFILPILHSCDIRTTARFEISNNSGVHLDSVKIEPNERKRGKYISLNTGEKAKYITDMTSEFTDGSYSISYLMNNEKKYFVFGYFTNGGPLEKLNKVQITRDSIIVEEIHGNY